MDNDKNIYSFSCKLTDGKEIKLSDFANKILLVVNTASKCGFTPQYKDLESLYKKYKDQDLEVLGFPCNQFGAQEPGSNEEIQSFCNLNYNVTFKLFDKIDVNGPKTSPLFKHLKNQSPGILGTEGIKWNFTKFLVNKDGEVVKRFSPKDTEAVIEAQLVKSL